MTDERQNLDSDPSTTTTTTTATAEPPAERATDERAEGQAAPPDQAASPNQPAAGAEGAQAASGDGEREGGGEVEQPVTAETAGGQEGGAQSAVGEAEQPVAAETPGGEEGEPLAAVGEVAGAEEAKATAADAGGDEAAGEAPAAVQAAETAAPIDAEGNAVERTAPTAEDTTGTAEAQTQAATTDGAAAPEPVQTAPPTGAAPTSEGAAAAEQAQAATPQAEAGAAPSAEGAVTPDPAETATPQAEASAPPTSEGAAAAEQADAATTQAEADATPTPEGTAAAEQAQPTAPQAEAGTAPTAESAAAEAPAAGEQAPAAEAAPPPEEPEDPALAELREAREKGTPVEGRVIGWNRGGFHVVVGAVTAFCPSSEMEVGRPKSPQSYVEKTFPFKVIKYQKKGRRVVLSRAGLLAEQRQEVLAGLKPGTVAKGRVTSLPDFGAFVDLGGIEGLVHVSEISRSRVQHPKDALQPGQEVEVKVLKIEQGGERISLSMKDLEPDPWQGAGQRFNRGDRFSGKALRKTEFGLFVELEPEVEGLLHVSQLPPGKTLDDPAYQPGQPIEGWVREVEPKRQRISLSLREVPTDDPWKEIGKRFPEGEMVEGIVESVAPFGVFIALAPGVTGLLPNSQTGLPRGTNAARAFAPGQSARVQVISVDSRRKRISLGREGTHVEASRNDLQDFKRQEREREKEKPTAMAAAFARLRGDRDDESREEQ